jgi:5-methylcytosine-specific restriction enzyme subunit McrC
MQRVFEAFVAKHLVRQLNRPFTLRAQASSLFLVRHQDQEWFRLKPDLLIQEATVNRMVLDTKWKHIDGMKSNGIDKYKLSQADFYQIHAYGHNYLSGQGDVVLIYPKTDDFDGALDKFEFPRSEGLRLWVLPFCLEKCVLILPACGGLDQLFKRVGDPADGEIAASAGRAFASQGN